jgi:hypothetical protein
MGVCYTLLYPNLEIEIHDYAPSSHSMASRKTIIEPCATQILHKPLEYEHGTYSKNSISGFGLYNLLKWLTKYGNIKRAIYRNR